MTLESLKKIFSDNGCEKIYIKNLAPNDNSKNQVYFAGNFEFLNILPVTNIIAEEAGDWKKERFKASLDFSWILENGELRPAPHSQLILYPKYPEVRFSGFLKKCENAPSELMTQRLANRLFFFSVTDTNRVIGYVTAPDSQIANEINSVELPLVHGVFRILELTDENRNRIRLLEELLRINQLGWIRSKRLDRFGNILPCEAPNCGGYTLEAELGITPNGHSEPDYLGWEIKQFGVSNFTRISSAIITLMTPEPTNGLYKLQGAENFLRTYGYNDRAGRLDRINFGGIHKVGILHPLTNLTLVIEGFDVESGKIRNATGKISLVDYKGNDTASWDFSSMLLHWNRKHNQACYIPSISDMKNLKHYRYGKHVILGRGTDFHLFFSSNG
ncbi:MvaI/BcnI family restriction endonuclease [Pedobacter lusitanus]|uniref:MvaI/BcnI family restriction endonuclease n=1 Tax=Pedobacter lusitanus TaxID=1503925 RepID=UPI000AE90E75|nr:MvaI/BcnI family restriction endonuclease [Pedobacter lusitanus]